MLTRVPHKREGQGISDCGRRRGVEAALDSVGEGRNMALLEVLDQHEIAAFVVRLYIIERTAVWRNRESEAGATIQCQDFDGPVARRLVPSDLGAAVRISRRTKINTVGPGDPLAHNAYS